MGVFHSPPPLLSSSHLSTPPSLKPSVARQQERKGRWGDMFNAACVCQSSSSDMGAYPHACRHIQTHSAHGTPTPPHTHTQAHCDTQSSCRGKQTWENMELLDILYINHILEDMVHQYVCEHACVYLSVPCGCSFKGLRTCVLSLNTLSRNTGTRGSCRESTRRRNKKGSRAYRVRSLNEATVCLPPPPIITQQVPPLPLPQ